MTERSSILQPGFSAGELSQRMVGRVDLPKRHLGAAKIENFIVSHLGDLTKRPGFEYISRSYSALTGRIIPWVYEDGDAYILEFTALKMRLFQGGAPVRDSHAITGATWAAGTAQITIASHHAVVGDTVVVSGMDPAGFDGTHIVTAQAPTTIDFALAADPGAFVSGGAVADPYTIVSPFALADLPTAQYSQIGDTMYFSGGKEIAARKLVRTSATSWAFSTPTFKRGPFDLDNGDDGNRLDPAAKTGNNIRIDADKGGTFPTDVVGRALKYASGAPQRWGYAVFDDRTSGIQAQIDITHDFKTHAPSNDWALGVFNHVDGSGGDNPRAVALYSGRLWWLHSNNVPNGIWSSIPGRFLDYLPHNNAGAAKADHAISMALAENTQVRIRWARGIARAMMIGTDTNIISLSGIEGAAIAPGSFEIKTASHVGTQPLVYPIFLENELFFVQKGGRKLRRLRYDIGQEAYDGKDMTLFADHIAEASAFTEMTYVDDPFPVIWLEKADGTLASCTHFRDEGEGATPAVEAWAEHIVGGGASVESVAVIPGTDHDELWAIISRTIDGNTVRYVERMTRPWNDSTTRDQCHFMDSWLEQSGAATTTMTGLEHLEGETVAVCADGNTVADQLVTNGQITVPKAAAVIIAGFSYNSKLLLYRMADEKLKDNLMGQHGKIYAFTLELLNTVGMRYSFEEKTDSADTYYEEFRSPDTPPDDAIPVFSGPKDFTLGAPWSRDSRIYLLHDFPQPCTIQAITTHWAIEAGKEA